MSRNTSHRTENFTIEGIKINIALSGDTVAGIRIMLSGEKNTGRRDSPLYEYFEKFLKGESPDHDLDLEFESLTPFRKSVYAAAMSIPYGKTATYRDVAEMIGGRRFSRAVGQALKHNPFPLIVPCHRVLPGGASIAHPGNFSSGKELKVHLLALEDKYARSSAAAG